MKTKSCDILEIAEARLAPRRFKGCRLLPSFLGSEKLSGKAELGVVASETALDEPWLAGLSDGTSSPSEGTGVWPGRNVASESG